MRSSLTPLHVLLCNPTHASAILVATGIQSPFRPPTRLWQMGSAKCGQASPRFTFSYVTRPPHRHSRRNGNPEPFLSAHALVANGKRQMWSSLAPLYVLLCNPAPTLVILVATGIQSPFCPPTRLWQMGSAKCGQASPRFTVSYVTRPPSPAILVATGIQSPFRASTRLGQMGSANRWTIPAQPCALAALPYPGHRARWQAHQGTGFPKKTAPPGYPVRRGFFAEIISNVPVAEG